MNLYNELEPYAAEWLGNLSNAGHIAPGTVDRRSIRELSPDDVRGATQFHAFAGLGAWSHALRLAGWPDDAAVWTGSCPCQPFSVAGQRRGVADERHLWPEWFRLIRECRPSVVFGEQVANSDGTVWLDAVFADLESVGYSCGAADLCAAGIGAPHRRQRFFFVAYSNAARCFVERVNIRANGVAPSGRDADISAADVGVVQSASEQVGIPGFAWQPRTAERLVDTNIARPQGRRIGRDGEDERVARASGLGGAWSDAEWIECRDGKTRPAQPGAFPLAHGAPARVGRLRAYGNAIVPQVAATFIRCAVDALKGAT